MADKDNTRTFDRALALMSVFAVLTAALAAVAAFRGGTAAPGTADEGDGPVTAAIELSEWAITGDLEVAPGELTITVTNSGTMVHNLVF